MDTWQERITGNCRITPSMRQIWSVRVGLLLIGALLSSCNGKDGSAASSVTFVQIPDVHLFDDSKRQPALKLWKEDENVFDWAIKEITKIKALKFVVFTGDLGLEMTGPYWEEYAVDYFVKKTELPKLDVQYILFVPGNNDLLNEEPTDIVRYRSFVTALGNALGSNGSKARVVDLSQQSIDIGNMRIHGLDSATFKNSVPCRLGFNLPPRSVPAGWTVSWTFIGFPTIDLPTLPVQSLWCKISDLTDRLNHQKDEMTRLANEVNDKTEKIHLIFTHIPPLDDPYSKPGEPPPWNLEPPTFYMWRDHVLPKMNCMFAAHFHTDDKKYYGINGLLKGDCNREIVVAPPLAIKFQNNKKAPARGLLKGTVGQNGTVSYEIVWRP